MQEFRGTGARVLFFGRHQCEATESLLNKLKSYHFDIAFVVSHHRNEKIPEAAFEWEGDYILCFRSLFILPKKLIEKAKIAAVNFHPATPEYPGSGCINFALYDGAAEYGVTAHLMNEKVDNGSILEVRRFPIHDSDNLRSLLSRTHNELLSLCSDFIRDLHENGERGIEEKRLKAQSEEWNGRARFLEELERLKTIPADVSKAELQRLIRATYISEFPPKVVIHGFNFFLKMDQE